MRISQYIRTLPPVNFASIRSDKRARKAGAQRDPFATQAKRVAAERLVATAEAKIGELDLTAAQWPGVIETLAGYGARHWIALTSVVQLVGAPEEEAQPVTPPAEPTPAAAPTPPEITETPKRKRSKKAAEAASE